MAIVDCSGCGGPVPTKTNTCLKCGNKHIDAAGDDYELIRHKRDVAELKQRFALADAEKRRWAEINQRIADAEPVTETRQQSLGECHACGGSISKAATSCPHCGHSDSGSRMHDKLLWFALLVVMLYYLGDRGATPRESSGATPRQSSTGFTLNECIHAHTRAHGSRYGDAKKFCKSYGLK